MFNIFPSSYINSCIYCFYVYYNLSQSLKKILLIEALSNSLKLECYKNKFIFVKHMDCSGAWAWTKDNKRAGGGERLPLTIVGARSNGVVEELKGSRGCGIEVKDAS